jgi:hypothetical protein
LGSRENLTAFQVRCIHACCVVIGGACSPDAFRCEPGPHNDESFCTATFDLAGHTLDVFVYADEAEFGVDNDRIDRRFEKWDYSSEEDLITDFTKSLRDTLTALRRS